MAKIKAIAFDFDGVVLESANVKTEAFVELFSSYGPDVQARVKAHHLAHLGISRFKKFEWIHEHILKTPLSDADSKALGERFSSLALGKVLAAPFVDGAYEALVALAPRFPLFVASGTPQGELDMIVDKRELRPLFREVHGAPKEKPGILTDLMTRFELSREELLFIGDGTSDHSAAQAVGVPFLARNTPEFHDYWVKHEARSRPDLTDLPAVVETW